MNTEELYKPNTTDNRKPGSEKYVEGLYNLLRTEERFFNQEEVNQFLVLPFETSLRLKNHSFNYIDKVYGFPIYFLHVSGSESSQLIFCTKEYFLELASEIMVEIFSNSYDQNLKVGHLERKLTFNLKIYLGLGDRDIKSLTPEVVTTIIDAFPERFSLHSKSAIDKLVDNVVSIKHNEISDLKQLLFLNEMIKLSRKNSTGDIKKLLLKLNLCTEDFGMTKPYGLQSVERLAELFPDTIKFDGTHITILPISERVPSSSSNKVRIDNFALKTVNLSGLVVFSFIGDTFPLKEAESCVSLRNNINFIAVSNLSQVFDKIFSDKKFELTKILTSLLGKTDISEWAVENLAVSFLIEDYEYLKLNFDQLMQGYSPVFNLEKNPGNLFRGIIEEKIREYESGK